MRLDTLTGILDHPGPFASALLDVSRTTEDARQRLELRGRAERHRRAAARLEEHLGRQYAVAVGLADVLDMTVQAGVDTVVLDEVRAAGRSVRPADHPFLPLPDGVRAAPAVRSDLLVLAAAAATGAGAVFTAPSLLPEDGVAALLRWDRPAPR